MLDSRLLGLSRLSYRLLRWINGLDGWLNGWVDGWMAGGMGSSYHRNVAIPLMFQRFLFFSGLF